jgi:Flp pilus assembly protein CpaB
MKNYIPLVLAVLLGLAAVFAVSRLLAARHEAKEETLSVVAAARDIAAGEELTEDAFMKKVVAVSARPAQAIAWSTYSMIQGQKAKVPIAGGDYILLSDIGLSRSMANIVGEGEWAITLNVGESGISKFIQPGDEVAVVGTFNIETTTAAADISAGASNLLKQATLVLFPRVRVLDVTRPIEAGEGPTGEILLALPPPQAQALIAAQRQAVELTLALRRPGDETAINRLDAGMVDEQTFASLLNGLKSVTVPAVPGKVETVEAGVK